MKTVPSTQDPSLMRLNAIYAAVEGEGFWVGMPQIFVRLQGCRVGCRNCDSKDTWSFNRGQVMSVTQVVADIQAESLRVSGSALAVKRVSITGGDPTDEWHRASVFELIKELKTQRYTVTLEASGNAVVHEIFDLLDYINFDVKTPGTGVEVNVDLLAEMARHYVGRFQIKSVVEDERDFDFCLKYKQALEAMVPNLAPHVWIITPAYSPGEAFPRQRFEEIYRLNFQAGAPFRVIAQQHKWIFGPDRKNV